MDGGTNLPGVGRRRRGKRREELRRFDCLSPRSLLSRWFPSSEKVRREEVERESRREGVGREVAQVGCSMEGLNGESSSCVLGVRRESQSNEASGNDFGDHLLSICPSLFCAYKPPFVCLIPDPQRSSGIKVLYICHGHYVLYRRIRKMSQPSIQLRTSEMDNLFL